VLTGVRGESSFWPWQGTFGVLGAGTEVSTPRLWLAQIDNGLQHVQRIPSHGCPCVDNITIHTDSDGLRDKLRGAY